MLNFNHVYYFHIVATEGTIARAAERLGVTQPTVSEQVRQLERTLGLSLFDRTSGGLRLTEAGRQAYEHTTAMFRAGERLLEVLGKTEEPVMPTLRVGITAAVSRTVAADFLMPVLGFEECVPVIRSGDLPELVRDLRAHDLDLVLCENQPVDTAMRGLRMVDVLRPRLVAIASPGLVADGGELSWNNLPMIQYRSSSAYRWEVDNYLGERGISPRVIGETDDALFMVEAVARGACAAFIPRSVARDALRAGRVRAVATLDEGSAAVHALYHDDDSGAVVRRAVEALVAYAKESLDH